MIRKAITVVLLFDSRSHRLSLFQGECTVIQPINTQSKRLEVHVGALVGKLVTASKEEVDGIVKVKIKVPVEVPADELGNLCFALCRVRAAYPGTTTLLKPWREGSETHAGH